MQLALWVLLVYEMVFGGATFRVYCTYLHGVKPIQLFTCGKRILHLIKLLSVRPSA
jgi:hypothetical protein